MACRASSLLLEPSHRNRSGSSAAYRTAYYLCKMFLQRRNEIWTLEAGDDQFTVEANDLCFVEITRDSSTKLADELV